MPAVPNGPRRGGRPSNEELEKRAKRDRFTRLAGTRVNAILGELDRLAMLSNKQRYEVTDEDITAIQEAITSKLDAAVRSLREGKNLAKQSFTLNA